MDLILERFVTALRQAGLMVSTSEVIDAFAAINLVGYANQNYFQNALVATLAKSYEDKKIVILIFKQFFSARLRLNAINTRLHKQQLSVYSQKSSSFNSNLHGSQVEQLSLIFKHGLNEKYNGLPFHAKQELYFSLFNSIGESSLPLYSTRPRKGVMTEQNIDALLSTNFYNSQNRASRECLLQRNSHSVAKELKLNHNIVNVSLDQIDEMNYPKMLDIIEKMTKRINDIHSRRKRKARKGFFDSKKTIRKCATFQGFLFWPQWKLKKINRANIIVLCDISHSVSWIARFFIAFLHGLSHEVANIRTFVFCSDITEVTKILNSYPVQQAITATLNSLGINMFLPHTDYGAALSDFKKKWFSAVSRKTTVIILGDARNNYFDPRIDTFRELSERCKRIIWLNPEAKHLWTLGDSEIKRYAPFCSVVQECKTLNHLKMFAGSI